MSTGNPHDCAEDGLAACQLAHGLTALGHDVEVFALASSSSSVEMTGGFRLHYLAPRTGWENHRVIAEVMPAGEQLLRTARVFWLGFWKHHRDVSFDVVDAPRQLAPGLGIAMTRVAPLVVRHLSTPPPSRGGDPHPTDLDKPPSFDELLVAWLERMVVLTADALGQPAQDPHQAFADYERARSSFAPGGSGRMYGDEAERFCADFDELISSLAQPLEVVLSANVAYQESLRPKLTLRDRLRRRLEQWWR